MDEQGRTFRRALLAPANVLALGAAATASGVTHDSMAISIAVGLEFVYLAGASLWPALARRLRRGRADPEGPSNDELLKELSPSQRDHYLTLRALRDQIESSYRKLPGGGVLAASSVQRVDALLTSFLKLVNTLNGYRKYLGVSDRLMVERELTELEADLKSESHERVREVKERRVEILRRRLARFQQAEESREVVSHQLAGIEDLLRLTHEQSIAIRDPESVGRQLDSLSAEVASTEETVRELERFMELSDEGRPPSPSEQGRVRG